MYRVTFGNKQAICPPIEDSTPGGGYLPSALRMIYTAQGRLLSSQTPGGGSGKTVVWSNMYIYNISHIFQSTLQEFDPQRKNRG